MNDCPPHSGPLRRARSAALALALLLAHTASGAALSPRDTALLDDIITTSLRFFDEQTHPGTGLVADAARADGSAPGPVASIAATGFGLSAFALAFEDGRLPADPTRDRVRATLRFLLDDMPHHRGFYYHFVDAATGERRWESELSSIDTALLLAGALHARAVFDDPEIRRLATALYERVNWPWMLDGGQTLSMGWTPEEGFLDARWDSYSELMILVLLGLGSPTHPLPDNAWQAWARKPLVAYGPYTFLACPPLFTHQYAHAWIDFRDRRDAVADYGRNSELATRAQRLFCMDIADRFPHYGPTLWGITSSLGPDGYKPWGAPPPTLDPPIDGTVVPCAPGGSLPFAPRICLDTLHHIKEGYGDRTWTHYGLIDAFNPATGWTADDVLGIDVGITLLMAHNLLDGSIWKAVADDPDLRRGLRRAGFVSTTPSLPKADRDYLDALAADTWRSIRALLHEPSGLPWDNANHRDITSVSNIGLWLASLVAAVELDLLPESDATALGRRTLATLADLPTHDGFRQCWTRLATRTPATNDPWVSVLDSGNLAAGLVLAGVRFPELRNDADALLDAMDWSAFYHAGTNALLGGYNTATGERPATWTLRHVGTDARTAQFLAVGSGRVPARLWQGLDRSLETRYRAEYYKPGWQGGGLFMQTLPAMWIDERHTPAWQSAANFTYAQIRHGRNLDLPAWGWSACEAPDGRYLGWGALEDSIVTPYAAAQALPFFPRQAVDSLRAMQARGARHPSLGFYDSLDLHSGAVATNFLVLDQAMILGAIANARRDGVLRTLFHQHPLAQRAAEALAEFRPRRYDALRADLRLSTQPKNIRNPVPPTLSAPYGNTPEPHHAARIKTEDGASTVAFFWTTGALHLAATVRDTTPRPAAAETPLYEGDSIELFLDPDADGLVWGSTNDFQFGFAPGRPPREWFGRRTRGVTLTTSREAETTTFRARIPWTTLGVSPEPGRLLGLCPTVIDRQSHDKLRKFEWHWQPQLDRTQLGRLLLLEPSPTPISTSNQ